MVNRSFVLATPNIPSPVTMPAQTMDSPESERDMMYCRAAHVERAIGRVTKS